MNLFYTIDQRKLTVVTHSGVRVFKFASNAQATDAQSQLLLENEIETAEKLLHTKQNAMQENISNKVQDFFHCLILPLLFALIPVALTFMTASGTVHTRFGEISARLSTFISTNIIFLPVATTFFGFGLYKILNRKRKREQISKEMELLERELSKKKELLDRLNCQMMLTQTPIKLYSLEGYTANYRKSLDERLAELHRIKSDLVPDRQPSTARTHTPNSDNASHMTLKPKNKRKEKTP